MNILTPDEQRTLHQRFKQNDLYRQWSPILSMLQRQYGEADAQTLWHLAVRLTGRLRNETSYREHEIAPIYSELLADGLMFDKTVRTKEQAQRTATTVMCILLTMLMNAIEKGHEGESFANEPMCMAIMDILSGDVYFKGLMDLFFRRRTGYDGQPVVITPNDPMTEGTSFESMDEVSKEEINQMVRRVVGHTEGLKGLFKEYWMAWEPLWRDICADNQFFLLMKEVKPRGNDWYMNQKMVCNVVGMFNDKTKSGIPISKLNDAFCEKNIRTYIGEHADYDGTNSVFDREQHDKIMRMIEQKTLSVMKN